MSEKETNLVTVAKELVQLVGSKQEAYGDSFGQAGKIISVLYPNGVPPEKVQDMLTVTRIVDKLFRIATSRDALGESPWDDIAGYALLAATRTRQEKEKNKGS